MRLIISLIFSIAVATQLTACFPLAVGAAATGASVAADRRTTGIYVEDQNIELKAKEQIRREIGNKADAGVVSYNRNVLLVGQAFNESYKQQAEAIIKSIPNVRHVTNEMTIDMPTTFGEDTGDAYITSKVKARLVAQSAALANNTKVYTEAKVVYLMGLLTEQEAAQAADIAQNTDGVTKVVKVFEYIQQP